MPFYFPSHEILTDELRDYRFYADDMLHPSELARQIIFERFASTHFDDAALRKIIAAQDAARGAAHRPLAAKPGKTA